MSTLSANPVTIAEPALVTALVPNWLGDVAMCTPALRALRTCFPHARIVAVGRGGSTALLADAAFIDDTVTVPGRGAFVDLLRLRFNWPHARPDLAVVFPHSARAALMARVLGARQTIGYDRGGRGWLLHHRREPHRESGRIAPVYMAEEYLGLVAALGAKDDGRGLELGVDPEADAAIASQLTGDGPLIGIAPGAAFGPSKRWLPERYAAVADALREQVNARPLLLTGPGEEDTRDAVLAASRHGLLQLEGPGSIARLKAAINRLDLLIGNDSGPRHVAIAFGVPVICIMGPTKPVYSCGPYEKGAVLRVDVYCGPCQQPTCATDHRCMTRITAGSVVEAAIAHLGDRVAG